MNPSTDQIDAALKETVEDLRAEIGPLDSSATPAERAAPFLAKNEGRPFSIQTLAQALGMKEPTLSAVMTTLSYNHWWIDTFRTPSLYRVDRVGYTTDLVPDPKKYKRAEREPYRAALIKREAAERVGAWRDPKPRRGRYSKKEPEATTPKDTTEPEAPQGEAVTEAAAEALVSIEPMPIGTLIEIIGHREDGDRAIARDIKTQSLHTVVFVST